MPRTLLLCIIWNIVWTASYAFSDRHYTAAVFEHAVQGNWTQDAPEDIVKTNLAYFEAAAKEAKSKGADIIVFPEYGIFPFSGERELLKRVMEYVPDPQTDRTNPCEESESYPNSTILRTLSCMAKKYAMVVVANMADIQPCRGEPGCPDDGSFHFNTNVAFDSDGTLVGRYHKEHLFFEKGMDLPTQPQDPTFQTRFGKFAMFVCFDIVFKRVAEVASVGDVEAVLLTTMWIDPTPLMTSVQLWQSWAIGNNVTFMAANVQMPGYAAVGSGIFDGAKGPIGYSFNPDGLSKLIVAQVPRRRAVLRLNATPVNTAIIIRPLRNDDDNAIEVGTIDTRSGTEANTSTTVITLNGTKPYTDDGKDVPTLCSIQILGNASNLSTDYRCLEEDLSNYALIKLNNSQDSIDLCNNGLCCSLDYTSSDMSEDFYFGVYNGTYNMFDRYYWSVENCLLVRCDSWNGTSCRTFPMRSNTSFYRVQLRGSFTTGHVYPSVLGSGMRIVPVDSWGHGIDRGHRLVKFEDSTGAELIVVGLNGRAYDRDPPYVR